MKNNRLSFITFPPAFLARKFPTCRLNARACWNITTRRIKDYEKTDESLNTSHKLSDAVDMLSDFLKDWIRKWEWLLSSSHKGDREITTICRPNDFPVSAETQLHQGQVKKVSPHCLNLILQARKSDYVVVITKLLLSSVFPSGFPSIENAWTGNESN